MLSAIVWFLIDLSISAKIIEEARNAVIALFPDKTLEFDKFIESLNAEKIPVPSDDEIKLHKYLIRDPKDVHVALIAMQAQVDFLISSDRDFTDKDEYNQALHEKIRVTLPGTFLREQMGWSSEALEIIRKRTWDDLI